MEDLDGIQEPDNTSGVEADGPIAGPWMKHMSLGLGYALKQGFLQRTFAERSALIFFYIVFAHAVFMHPYMILVPGERTNLFTPILLGLCLLCGFIAYRGSGETIQIAPREALLSLVLGTLLLLSGWAADTSFSSSIRSLSIVLSGTAGFWCSKVFFRKEADRALLLYFCCLLSFAFTVSGFVDLVLFGSVHGILKMHHHPLTNTLIFLSFAPLTLIIRGDRTAKIVGISLLTLNYIIFIAAGSRIGLLLPLVMGGAGLAVGYIGRRGLLLAVVPVLLILVGMMYAVPEKRFKISNYESVYYRIESWPMAKHTALKRPWLGTGPRAPKEKYLADYTVQYPYVNEENYSRSLKRIVTFDNIYLTFFAEAGIPFTLLYFTGMAVLLVRLLRKVKREGKSGIPPPLALFLPLVGAVAHFFVFDGLYYPQICFMFHLWLGMIAFLGSEDATSEQPAHESGPAA